MHVSQGILWSALRCTISPTTLGSESFSTWRTSMWCRSFEVRLFKKFHCGAKMQWLTDRWPDLLQLFNVSPGLGVGSQILKVLSEVKPPVRSVSQMYFVLWLSYNFFSSVLSSQTAAKTRCSSMHFIVAENNKKSIEFYKRRGAADLSSQEGWRLFAIGKEGLLKMANK